MFLNTLIDIYDDINLFSADKAAHAVGMSARFKGGSKSGGSSSPPSSAIGSTALGKDVRETIYPIYQRALEGKGLTTSSLLNTRIKDTQNSLLSAYKTASAESESRLNRILDPRDNLPRNYIQSRIKDDYIRAQDYERRSLKNEQLLDQDQAMSLSATAVGNEMRMGMANMQAYNQAVLANQQNEQRYGTFGTNLYGGLGSALTSTYYASQMAKK